MQQLRKSLRHRYRQRIYLETKYEICLKFLNGCDIEDISTEYNLGIKTVQGIVSQSDRIVYQCSFIPNLRSIHKLRPNDRFELERVLFVWVCHWNKRNVPLTYGQIKAKADSMWTMLKNPNNEIEKTFTLGESFMPQFFHMYHLTKKKLKGEKGSADLGSAIRYKKDLMMRMNNDETCTPKNCMFNLDETALYTKISPNYTYSAKGIPCTGSRLYKDHVTVLVGCNATGDCRLTPLVLGKAKNPRMFKYRPITRSVVIYKYSKSGWMTSDIFLEYVRNEFRMEVMDYCLKKKIPFKIELFIDNAPSHNLVKVVVIEGITITMLPPNTTSLIQPMDQSIIWSFKRAYLKSLNDKLLTFLIKNRQAHPADFWGTIDIATVLRELLVAWISVKQETMVNGWKPLLDPEVVLDTNQCASTDHQSEMSRVHNKLYLQFMEKNLEDVDWNSFFNLSNIQVFMNELIDIDDSEFLDMVKKNTAKNLARKNVQKQPKADMAIVEELSEQIELSKHRIVAEMDSLCRVIQRLNVKRPRESEK